MGKAYANRKGKDSRPEGDFYSTPKSLVWAAADIIESSFDKGTPILEPCHGEGAISGELRKMGYNVVDNDLYRGGCDYLTTPFQLTQIITNPPFSLWDSFVDKAKKEADVLMCIGRLNYLGTHSRNVSGVWSGLKAIYCFDRYVDYRTEFREDGLFHVGAMATAWFLWLKGYKSPPTLHVLDVQEWAKLGNSKS